MFRSLGEGTLVLFHGCQAELNGLFGPLADIEKFNSCR